MRLNLIKTAVMIAFLSPFSATANELYQTGRDIFLNQAQPHCAICHTLKDANATGQVGPNLNELQPTAEQVINAVSGGVGIMPAFDESLSPEQIKAVAEYVSTASRQ